MKNYKATDEFSDITFSEDMIESLLEGILMGNLYGCNYISRTLTVVYYHGFFPGSITSVDVYDIDYDEKTASMETTDENGKTKKYDLSYSLDNTNSRILDVWFTPKNE